MKMLMDYIEMKLHTKLYQYICFISIYVLSETWNCTCSLCKNNIEQRMYLSLSTYYLRNLAVNVEQKSKHQIVFFKLNAMVQTKI